MMKTFEKDDSALGLGLILYVQSGLPILSFGERTDKKEYTDIAQGVGGGGWSD